MPKHTSISVEVSICLKKSSYPPINTCKLDSRVKTHSEITKNKIFLEFLDMIFTKQKTLTPHTYVKGIMHFDALRQVEPIARLRPRIFFIINDLISRCCHHMAYHDEAMPHWNGSLRLKILIIGGFLSYVISLMAPINT
jgi:hypothetical protein